MIPEPQPSESLSVDGARLQANWRAIEIELDTPRVSRAERTLRRCGVPSRVSRLVVATPALRRAWYLAIAGSVLIALSAADPAAPRRSVLVFLTVAPLLGVLGVAMAYGPSADPAYEIQLAMPMRGLRVLAIRTCVVLTTSAIVVTPFTLLNEVTRPFAVVWFLPAIAVTATSLALMTAMAPRRAVASTAIGWCGVVLVSQVGDDPLVAFGIAGQVVAVGVAALAITAVVARRTAFDRMLVLR